ncbi:hypothetical protein GQ53DRAFT_122989 [Thozetella sp. PMI_491]|nr:hypothetical protein GQ53DRAFT_122989 [Thozetella sp. PMI_491]
MPLQQKKKKSRTGCTTCKIRKVKCDEEKPACRRCTSTGRVCDGYAVVREYDSLRHKTQSTCPPLLQPSAGTIPGTENERRFFHCFRAATQEGVTIQVDTVASFWANLAPRLAHHDEAVRHALIALGATYHFFKLTKEGSRSVSSSRYQSAYQGQIQKFEVFIIRNYNLAISKLRSCIASPQSGAVISALVCCIVFVCLENLRFNLGAAITHLKNGAQIMDKAFDLRRLFNPSLSRHPATKDRPVSALVSDDELRDVAICFRHLEISTRLFAFDVPLTVTRRFYDSSRLDDSSCVAVMFTSLDDAHRAVSELVNDVMGYDSEITRHRGDPVFWSTPRAVKRHGRLLQRANDVLDRYKSFMTSANAPAPGTRESASCYQDFVHTVTMRGMVELMPPDISAQHQQANRLLEVVHYAEKLFREMRAIRQKLNSPLDFTVEPGVVAALYYGCVYTTDLELKERILGLLSECTAREGPWDGRSLVKVVQLCSKMDEQAGSLRAGSRSLTRWGSDMDCYRLFLALDITEW